MDFREGSYISQDVISQQVNKSKLIDRDVVQEVHFVITRSKEKILEETFLTIYSWLLSEGAHWTFALSHWIHSYLFLFSHNLLRLNSSEASNPLLDLVMIGKRLKKLWRGVKKRQQERHTAGIREPSFFTFLNDSSKKQKLLLKSWPQFVSWTI